MEEQYFGGRAGLVREWTLTIRQTLAEASKPVGRNLDDVGEVVPSPWVMQARWIDWIGKRPCGAESYQIRQPLELKRAGSLDRYGVNRHCHCHWPCPVSASIWHNASHMRYTTSSPHLDLASIQVFL